MIRQTLHDGWSVRAVASAETLPSSIRDAMVPARVPGCVHSDLIRAGLIDDPCCGMNEPQLLWIGRTDWQYSTSFDADSSLFDHERIDLVCDGLDTVATILLNDIEIARTRNMHRGYRFDVRKALRKGRNELTIRFESPVHYARKMRDRLGAYPAITYGGHHNYIRKMACNFGWDWGPIVPTCGIWRTIALEGWTGIRICSAAVEVLSLRKAASSFDVRLRLRAETENSGTHKGGLIYSLSNLVSGKTDDSNLYHEFDARVTELWWPAGYGPQALHKLRVETGRDVWEHSIGLRTVELDTAPDEIGRGFVLKVNGKPIFCKGFNWIPDHCFTDCACDSVRIRKRIQQAVDANANMLRVWGGGTYESDDFYDICDEMGVLVWQDFMFACAMYPEVEPIRSEVEAEARYNVARLARHPSLALWNGCNENLWGYHAWWDKDEHGVAKPWKELVKGKGWGAGYYLDLLPKIVAERDPSRPYWAASPWSGDADVDNGLHPNLCTHGNKHIWEVWHGPGDYSNYRLFTPRFCSEFGYQGPANYATMKQFCSDPKSQISNANDLHPDALPAHRKEELMRGSPWLELHQKSPGGNERNDRLLAKDFDIEKLDFDDWHYLLQLNQARALTAGVEWFRSRQPVCMGTLYWQLNDCYPGTSWSAIDCAGRLKPLWYATRRFYAPRLLTIQPESDALVLYANNDSDLPWNGAVRVRRIDFAGRELHTIEIPLAAPPRTNVRAAVLPIGIVAPQDKSREMIVADLDGSRATWFFAPDRELSYPPPAPRVSMLYTDGGYRCELQTDVMLRDVMINIDRIDPEAMMSDNVVTLLPGERWAFQIETAEQIEPVELERPPVFQCANRFGLAGS